MEATLETPVEAPSALLKLDIGCGPNKQPGFTGVDQYAMPGVDVVTDLRKPWPWANESVAEIHCAHFLEHLTNLDDRWERVHFFNELGRVLTKDGRATLIFPHWASVRYYGDPTHKEPFSEMGFYYISKEWRMANAPHTDSSVNPLLYSCDLGAVWGYSFHPGLNGRNQEYVNHASTFWINAVQDIHATITRKT